MTLSLEDLCSSVQTNFGEARQNLVWATVSFPIKWGNWDV